LKLFESKNQSKINYYGLITILLLLFFSSCSPIRNVPENEYLLDRYRVKVKEGKVKKEDLKVYVKQKPNKRILGIRFHLWLYNLARKDKDKGISGWLKSIGEEPVIYDDFLTEKSVTQLQSYLQSKGYYNSQVIDTVQFRRKRARVLYKIYANEPYIINDINYTSSDSVLADIVLPDTVNSLISKGDNFDIDILDEERKRIETNLKNLGYYNFNKEYISFLADSSVKNRNVKLVLNVNQFSQRNANGQVDSENHKKYKIRNVYIFTNFDQKEALALQDDYFNDLDTIYEKGIYFISKGEERLNKRAILQSNFIQPGGWYSLNNANKTYKHLNSLRLFKIINIQFYPIDSSPNDSSQNGYLDCQILLTKFFLQSYTVELQGTNSYGNIGVGGNFTYQHRSMFGGAEITDFRLYGNIEALDTSLIGFRNISNATELGGSITLTIPKFLLPIFKGERFSKQYSPKTQIIVGYNFQDRLEYRRSVANLSYGYNWDGNRYLKHYIKLLEVNAVNLPYASTDFKNWIDSTYLKSSYDNHLVSFTNYSLVFNNQNIKKTTDFYFLRLNTEVSGNILCGISELTKAAKNDEGRYLVFGVPFSQYAKMDIDLRYYDVVDKANTFVYRFFGGIGIPYGNSLSLPFEKMFFSGGANSIRAWNVRDVGPGSYSGGTKTRFPNQTGDIKLEANVEYRFQMFWVLEGALFLDAGNVWNLNSDEFEGGLFRKNEFYKELAVGSGFGLRFNFNFFIFRLDLGLKMRDPSLEDGSRWIIGNQKLTWRDDFTLNLGIGYPF